MAIPMSGGGNEAEDSIAIDVPASAGYCSSDDDSLSELFGSQDTDSSDDEVGRGIFPGSVMRYMSRKEMDEYYRAVSESEGFDVPDFWWSVDFGVITRGGGPEDPEYPDVQSCAQFAINHHNNHDDKGKKLELMEIIKWNSQMAGSYLAFYITLQAKDLKTKELDVYQAKVYTRPWEEVKQVKIFRKEDDAKRNPPEKPEWIPSLGSICN